jgi:[acyl-carrier-protein] S-malonyltransferase
VSKTALIFPGQGAQAVGMGRDLFEAHAPAREAFEEASEAIGLDLAALCFEGPIERLSASDVAQPAILTVSIAALRAMAEEAGRAPAAGAMAGLSLGEYSALVAAGALDFAGAVRLVRRRGLYMQQACEASPGTMYSILGLQDGPVEQACEEARRKAAGGVWPANYNCPGQLVISGEAEAAALAAELCSERGARRAVQLNVAGAFHTPLMQAAADLLAPELAAAEFRAPSVPVVANVTGRPVEAPDQMRELLARQVTSPVRWTDCMRWVIDRGIVDHVEVGPGRVLQGLLRRIEPSCACRSVGGPQDVQDWARQKADGPT